MSCCSFKINKIANVDTHKLFPFFYFTTFFEKMYLCFKRRRNASLNFVFLCFVKRNNEKKKMMTNKHKQKLIADVTCDLER